MPDYDAHAEYDERMNEIVAANWCSGDNSNALSLHIHDDAITDEIFTGHLVMLSELNADDPAFKATALAIASMVRSAIQAEVERKCEIGRKIDEIEAQDIRSAGDTAQLAMLKRAFKLIPTPAPITPAPLQHAA